MSLILKKSFLFHYDPSINSDKVFNLFVIDNQNGSYSAISEYGRSGTKLAVKPLIENCSLSLAQSHFTAKLDEKIYHKRTPYLHTLNPSTSPTYKQLVVQAKPLEQINETAKIYDFKSVQTPLLKENESGEEVGELREKRSKQIGVLNLNQLDALEF